MTEPTAHSPAYDEPSPTRAEPDPVGPPFPEPESASEPDGPAPESDIEPGPPAVGPSSPSADELEPAPAVDTGIAPVVPEEESEPAPAADTGVAPMSPEEESEPAPAADAGIAPVVPEEGSEPASAVEAAPTQVSSEAGPDGGPGDPTGAGEVGSDLPVELLPDDAVAAAPPTVEPTRVKPGKHARGGGGSDRTPAAATSGRAARRGLLPALVVLVVLLAALVGFLARLSVTTRGTDPLELQRRDALAAARASSRLIFSYDYRHLAQDFAAGRAFTTGAFRTEYDTTTTKLVTDVAQRYKGVAVADVSAAAVETSSKNHVVALVFLNQQSSSTIQTTPKISQSRLEMTLVRTGGHWLVSGVKAL